MKFCIYGNSNNFKLGKTNFNNMWQNEITIIFWDKKMFKVAATKMQNLCYNSILTHDVYYYYVPNDGVLSQMMKLQNTTNSQLGSRRHVWRFLYRYQNDLFSNETYRIFTNKRADRFAIYSGYWDLTYVLCVLTMASYHERWSCRRKDEAVVLSRKMKLLLVDLDIFF